MLDSKGLPRDRLTIGQLLVRLLTGSRRELFAAAEDGGYPDIWAAHLQIFGNAGLHGIRLTTLAARAPLSLAATSELVKDLEALGCLERRPDRADGRAKLIFPTEKGRRALSDAGNRVAEIEDRGGEVVGSVEFAHATRTLQTLLTRLSPQ